MRDGPILHKSYLVARVSEALAEDARLNELDIQVTMAAGKVFLLGEVASEERRRTASTVASAVLPEGVEIVNNLHVARYRESGETEELR